MYVCIQHCTKWWYFVGHRQKTFGKGEERKIHVSRYAFRALHENIGTLRAAMKDDSKVEDMPRIKMTKVQLATVSVFAQNHLKYLTISYEKEDSGLDFSRTINLSEEEAATFERIIPQICEILNYAEYLYTNLNDSLVNKEVHEEDEMLEGIPIKAYVLRNREIVENTYEEPEQMYLSQRNAEMARFDLTNKDAYDIVTININRPTKYAIVQYVIKEELLKKAIEQEVPISRELFGKLDKDKLRVLILAALKEVSYLWPLFVNELVGAFVYCGGLTQIMQEEESDHRMDMQEECLLRAAYSEALTHI